MIAPFLFIILVAAFYVVLFAYGFSLNIRRWHDLGQSGWMSLLSLIPLVNLVVLIYLMCAKGTEGPNAYGEPNVGKPFWKSVFAPGSLNQTAPIASAPVMPTPPPVVPPAPMQ